MAQKQQAINLYRKIALSFIILTFILVVVILYFSFASVTITIFPTKEKLRADFIVNIEEGAVVSRVGVMPGKLGEITLKESQVFPVSGTKEIGTEVTGTVTIINNYSKNQPLVATTRLLTPEGILFRLSSRVEVPAGGKIEGIAIYADDPESITSKIDPTRFTIPGLWSGLQDKIYAESYTPIVKKTTKVSALTQAEIDGAKEKFQNELFKKALENLNQNLKNGIAFKEKSALKRIVSSEVDKKVGEEVNEFNLTLELEVQAVAFLEQEILKLAQDELEKRLPDDKELSRINLESFDYSLEKYDTEGKTASLKVYLESEMILKSDSPLLSKDKLMGLSGRELESYLTSFEAIEKVKIKFMPFWVKKVPRLKDHIKIEIEK